MLICTNKQHTQKRKLPHLKSTGIFIDRFVMKVPCRTITEVGDGSWVLDMLLNGIADRWLCKIKANMLLCEVGD